MTPQETPPLPGQLLGLGMDLLAPSELIRSLKSPGFRRQVFSPEELASHGDDLQGLAEAFALKEALVKAMGTGRIGGIEFHEVSWLPSERPGTLKVRAGSRGVIDALGVGQILGRVEMKGPWVMGIVMLFA